MWIKLLRRIFTEADFIQIANGVAGSMDFGDALKRKSPLLYWLLILFLLAVLMTPAMIYCIWLETGGAPNSQHVLINLCYGAIGLVGLVAAMLFAIAPVNEIMRLCRGYLGWKVTVLCAVVGGAVTLLCAGIMHIAAIVGI